MAEAGSTGAPNESGALDHPNVGLVRDYQAAMARGDFEERASFFWPDVEYHVPGNNRLSGNFRGPEEVMGYFGRLMEMTGGTYRITDLRWMVDDEDRVVLVTRNQAEMGGRSHEWDEVILFEIQNGKKRRIYLFQADQEGVDEFYGRG